MPTFQTYNVTPTLPAVLEPLREMSFNLWWTWEPSARRLFRQLDPELWNRTNHNPVRMLQLSRQSRLEEVSQDKAFLRELRQVFEAFEKYLGRKDTYGKTGAGSAIKNPVAYFSAEFGFHESIPNYSGGLGILASDHCKSASDLDLNFVAIGRFIDMVISGSRSTKRASRRRSISIKIFITCRFVRFAVETRTCSFRCQF
jgi:starch phosphorylase